MRRLNFLDLALVVLIALIFAGLFDISFSNNKTIAEEEPIEVSLLEEGTALGDLSLEGYSGVEVSVNPGLIQLTSECRAIILNINQDTSYSIKKGLDGDVDFRPLTHDTIKSILENYGIEVMMVKIYDLKTGTYFADLFLKKDNKILNLDTRPSDAISIAVRFDKPIYIRNDLLEAGTEVC